MTDGGPGKSLQVHPPQHDLQVVVQVRAMMVVTELTVTRGMHGLDADSDDDSRGARPNQRRRSPV